MQQNKHNPYYWSHSRKRRKSQPEKKNKQHRRDFKPDYDRNENHHRDSRLERTLHAKDNINLPSMEKSPLNSGNTDIEVGVIPRLTSWFRKNFLFWVKPSRFLNVVK